jgi:hypothetical protein
MFQNQLIAADEIFRTGRFCGSSRHFASLGACCGFAASRTQRLGAPVQPAEIRSPNTRTATAGMNHSQAGNCLRCNYLRLARQGTNYRLIAQKL